MLGLRHHTSAIITDCNRSTTLSPRLDLPGFPPDTETKREVWLLRTGFGIAVVNKLVSLTWLLWALRSFRSFTLAYIYIYITLRLAQSVLMNNVGPQSQVYMPLFWILTTPLTYQFCKRLLLAKSRD